MYLPLIKAFNYALDRLSTLQAPCLPEFQSERQLVFARSATKCIESESYLQGSYKPDIILVKWITFKRVHECTTTYSQSYESNICCESGCDQPKLSWRNLLSTLEVKRGALGGAGNHGKKPSKGKARENFVNSTYIKGFQQLEGDLDENKPSTSSQSAPPRMVDEENPTRTRTSTPPFASTFSSAPVATRHGLRNRESSSSTSDRLPSLQKRRRNLYESDGNLPKRSRSDTNTTPGGTSEQEVEAQSEKEVEEPKRPQKQAPKVQSAIYASHKISSSFDISHTINLLLIGTWVGFQLDLHWHTLDRYFHSPHLDRPAKCRRVPSYRPRR